MDRQRAQAIIDSPQTITVTHQDQAVWIEKITSEAMAEVSLLTTHEHLAVPLEELNEM
jgi:H-type small acid-soluble spore protein